MDSPSEPRPLQATLTGPFDHARAVVRLAESRPATLGMGRLVCVDGPSGSGKTTLAGAVADRTGAAVVHMDDLMEGWQGMAGTGGQLASIVEPMAAGRPGSYRHFNWFEHRFDRVVELAPSDWLVIEGVGSGSPVIAAYVTVLVWVEVDDVLRLRRGLDRDGAEMETHWREWMRQEVGFFHGQRTRDRADLHIVDGALQ
jgi:cytidylate kinase